MEKESIVNKYRITYEGLFSAKELYKLIDNWFKDHGYDKNEIRNIESVNPEGKYIEIEIEPDKGITDYAKLTIHLRIILSEVKDVDVEKDGRKIRLNQGKVHIVMDGYVLTDYENRWETQPVFFFIRTIFDKYIYRPFTSGYRVQCKKEVNELRDTIKSFLNLYKF